MGQPDDSPQGDDQTAEGTATTSQNGDPPPDDRSGSRVDETDLDRDFILIHEGASSTQYEQMDRTRSVEAKLARARGRGRFPLADGSVRSRPRSDDGSYAIRIDRGKINIDTGYVMRFVDPELRHMTVFDLCSSPEDRSFPVPENALQSLPPGLRGILEEQGYLQIQGDYDKTTQEFVDVLLGWDVAPEDPLDELMKIVKELDGRLAPAISYMMYTYGPNRWADPGIIAEARGIEESTVREQIENAKADLPERFQEPD